MLLGNRGFVRTPPVYGPEICYGPHVYVVQRVTSVFIINAVPRSEARLSYINNYHTVTGDTKFS